jgi:hypothetical protein
MKILLIVLSLLSTGYVIPAAPDANLGFDNPQQWPTIQEGLGNQQRAREEKEHAAQEKQRAAQEEQSVLNSSSTKATSGTDQEKLQPVGDATEEEEDAEVSEQLASQAVSSQEELQRALPFADTEIETSDTQNNHTVQGWGTNQTGQESSHWTVDLHCKASPYVYPDQAPATSLVEQEIEQDASEIYSSDFETESRSGVQTDYAISEHTFPEQSDLGTSVSSASSEGSDNVGEILAVVAEPVIKDEGSERPSHSTLHAFSVQSAPEALRHGNNEVNGDQAPRAGSPLNSVVEPIEQSTAVAQPAPVISSVRASEAAQDRVQTILPGNSSAAAAQEPETSVEHSLNFDGPEQESGVSASIPSTGQGATNLNQITQGMNATVKTEPLPAARENSNDELNAEDFEEAAFYNTALWEKMIAQVKGAPGYVSKRLDKKNVEQEKSAVPSEQKNVELEELSEIKEIKISPIITSVVTSESFFYKHQGAVLGVGAAVIVTGVMGKMYIDGYFDQYIQRVQKYLKKNK